MPFPVRFAYICKYTFGDLQGEDRRARYCNECGLDVTNLDAMDEAEADLFLKSIRPRQRVCVASSFVLNETAACSDMAMPMPITAGVPIQAEIRDTYLEVFSDGSSSFEQLTLVKDLTSNPNRLAIAKVFKASQSLKLGPYRIGQLEDRTKDALSSVGLRWSIVDVPEGENVPEALAPRIS